jgi:hypothetical protein
MLGFNAYKVGRVTQNGDHWVPLAEDKMEPYCILLQQWAHAILLSIEGHDSGYKFPLTPGDLDRASQLKEALQHSPNSLHIDIFHEFIMPFMYPKLEGRSPGEYTKWDDVSECLFALSSLNEDGNFKPANLVTGMFAKMKYFIRSTILYQGMEHKREDENCYE